MDNYLQSTPIINWQHSVVLAKARELAAGGTDPTAVAQSCFTWVRDAIKHIDDYNIQEISCSASEVLLSGAGICYAKSHLLAALLRANSIPAGFCYQRLSRDDDGASFCLHGLNAVYLPDYGWYRIDARGNKAGVNAQFAPPSEQLAFSIRLAGEADLPEIWPSPLPVVIEALGRYTRKNELWDNLPDVQYSG
ncbi:MAG: transglutaminase family protein [Proteobacteria bacterium]|nr:transglutaminase family protein [Pseudomonadota bacterium]MBU4295352.1 transglutaminase family protein [Pseudomonadota bacterium]MCG2748208.1 transglutaminase family protein [Desulfobulbaceae bacterium]